MNPNVVDLASLICGPSNIAPLESFPFRTDLVDLVSGLARCHVAHHAFDMTDIFLAVVDALLDIGLLQHEAFCLTHLIIADIETLQVPVLLKRVIALPLQVTGLHGHNSLMIGRT